MNDGCKFAVIHTESVPSSFWGTKPTGNGPSGREGFSDIGSQHFIDEFLNYFLLSMGYMVRFLLDRYILYNINFVSQDICLT